jgi:diguanylate cyclase (GGDEF)-like protein/PAS domain S-box-containing protein
MTPPESRPPDGNRLMPTAWPRLVGRLEDGPPEARYEATLALLRACLGLVGGVTLLLAGSHPRLLVPAAVNLLVGLLSAGAAVGLARVQTAQAARRWGRWSTLGDVLLFAAYSWAFHDTPGAGTLFGLYVLLVGPIRYGLRGLPVTVLPVALVAAGWPQLDAAGRWESAGQVVLLSLLFALPAVVVRAVVMRGSARLRQAEEQFATAFEHASIGMALADLDLHVRQANRALGTLVGSSPAQLLGTRLDAVVDRPDRERITSALRSLTAAAPSTRLEVRLRRPDGGLRWGHVSASLLAGSGGVAPRVVVQVENITERKRSEAMLSHAAAHDALTDLPNRSLLLARLDAALHQGEQVAVLFLDLDRFKVVNDGLGHAAGDLLLVQVAIRLRDVMRPDDMVARLGGDEFVALCRNADSQVAETVAQRVLEALNQPVATARAGELVIGGSIGIALAGPGDTAESVLRDADTAMYAAKAAGGGRAHLFTRELRDAVVRTHELEVDLRAAVRALQLSVVYQPVVSLPHGKVLGCEALVRWNHPQRGPIPPQEFVTVAEQSDLILELGEWVLARALRDAGTWPSPAGGPRPTVSVNVSLRQLTSPSFVERVATLLADSDVEAARLCLEVTETVLAGDVEPVITVLEALRDVGVRLSIDDFGTGHASLTYLARFPVDQVKVDQSFVAGLGIDAGSAAIVGGVVGMAHTFDLRVIAEGVETETQLMALQEMGCDAVQGFLLAHPMTAPELMSLLRRNAAEGLVPLPRQGELVEVRPEDRSYDEVRRTQLLVEGAKQVTGRLDLDAVLEQAFLALGTAVRFTGGSILLVDGEQIRIAAGMPTPTADALAARIPLGQGVSGAIAATGEPRYLPDITIASTVTAGRRSTSSSTGVRTWYGVPLIAEGRPIGVLQLDSTEVDAFGEVDRLAVLSFAPVVALAVICARNNAAQLRKLQEDLGPA